MAYRLLWRAGARLGFQYEGTFRNATLYKGRSRDTAWFAITDADWPHLDHAYRVWVEATPGGLEPYDEAMGRLWTSGDADGSGG